MTDRREDAHRLSVRPGGVLALGAPKPRTIAEALIGHRDAVPFLPSESNGGPRASSTTRQVSPPNNNERAADPGQANHTTTEQTTTMATTTMTESSCVGCMRAEARRQEIEKELIPQVQGEMRQAFGNRAKQVGTGRALEEVFFRQEGLQTYGQYRGRLNALADELDKVQSGEVDDEEAELHTCMG